MSLPNNTIGGRLRRVRKQRGLTLHDVQAATGGAFRASALGAYERSERALSVVRLLQLCAVYTVDAAEIVDADDEIDLVSAERWTPPIGRPLDASRANDAVVRFVAFVRRERRVAEPELIHIRRSDRIFLRRLLGCDDSALRTLLERHGVPTTSLPRSAALASIPGTRGLLPADQ